MSRPTILLFDVDGTLVTSAGVGRRALERAFGARYGRSAVLRDVQFDGMTDRAIVRAGLRALDELAEGASAEAAIDALLTDYVPLLENEVACTPELGLQAGARTLLDALAGREGLAVGLGTGNIRAGAHAKLAPLGILDHFAFGGFGCDHEDRAELLRIGAARGALRLGVPVTACRIVVIGDTPRDVDGARAIGADAVCVSSARFGCAELRARGAAAAWETLGDPRVLGAVLGDDVTA